MATQKKSASKKSATKKGTAKRSASKGATKKSAAKKGATRKSAAKGPSSSVKKGVKTSPATAKKTGVKQAKGKKESLINQKRSTGSGPTCWPGYERVPGKQAGSKGSCKPKPNQTKGEKKEDAREAAGSKLRKAGGNKAKANHTR